jgi:hypothetical protein
MASVRALYTGGTNFIKYIFDGLTSWNTVPLEKPTVAQMAKKSQAVYGIRACHWNLSNPVHILTSYVVRLRFNTILPSTPTMYP